MSDCSCIYVEVDEPAQFSHTRMVRARKPHRCSECKGEIAPGTEYERTNMQYDGRFDTYRTCPDCLSVRDVMFCGSWYFERVWEDVREHLEYCDDFEICWLEGLTPVARAKVIGMFDETSEYLW